MSARGTLWTATCCQDIPNAMTMLGAGIVMASTLYITLREVSLGKPEPSAERVDQLVVRLQPDFLANLIFGSAACNDVSRASFTSATALFNAWSKQDACRSRVRSARLS